MNKLQEQLVDVYAAGPVAEVHASAAYESLCAAYRPDRVFDTERGAIERLRRRIDEYIGARDTAQKQVEFALRFTRAERERTATTEARRELIRKSYGKNWSAAQLDYFLEHSTKIAEGIPYFLSFTNRNRNRPAHNLVNRTHKHFIIDAIGLDQYSKRDHSAENLAALAVQCLLSGPFPEGFYYPRHLGDNQAVKSKLKDGCARALAFVQLVQQEIFFQAAGSANWCHQEYSWAREKGSDQIRFVQLDEEIREDPVASDWRDTWYSFFVKRDPLKLKPTRWEDPQAIDDNVQLITKGLAAQIDRTMERFYLGIPE